MKDVSIYSNRWNSKTRQISKTVEENRLTVPDKSQQFSYLWLLQTSDGTIHLLYTWHRSHIKHLAFNSAWLNQNDQEPEVISQ